MNKNVIVAIVAIFLIVVLGLMFGYGYNPVSGPYQGGSDPAVNQTQPSPENN